MKMYHLYLVLLASIVIFGGGQALATTYPNDPTSWLPTVTYANTGAGGGLDKYTCSAVGGGTDADDDGICDNWETNSGANPGLHISFTSKKLSSTTVTYRYDLSCDPNAVYSGATGSQVNDPLGDIVCPSPSQKDIYIEVDWMTGQDPNPQALKDVVAAYLKHGIHMHIQAGETPTTGGNDPSPSSGDIGVRYCDVIISTGNSGSPGLPCTTSTTNAQSYVLLKQNKFGTISERSGNTTFCPSNAMPTTPGTPAPTNFNSYNCLTAKRQVFHYAMFVNFQWSNISSGGWAEIPGNDFIVSLGNFQNNGKGNIDEQEASFMHELGHNLGLYHGGLPPPTGNADDDNCKPNYLSIMSYTYEYRETGDVCRPLDYSDRNLTASSINEQLLTDINLNSDTYPADNPNPPDDPNKNPACLQNAERPIWWSTPNNPQNPGLTGGQIDWNGDGFSTTNQYPQNINNLGFAGCNTPRQSSLSSYDDWGSILKGNGAFAHPLNFRLNPNFYTGTPAGNNDVEVAPNPSETQDEKNMDMTVRLPQPNRDTGTTMYLVIGFALSAIAVGVGYAAKRHFKHPRPHHP